jgi:hypothetical protein
MARRHAVAGDGLRVHAHLQKGLPRQLLDTGFARSAHSSQHHLHFSAQSPQLLQVVAEDFDADVAPDARDQFIHAHLNGLAERRLEARHLD